MKIYEEMAEMFCEDEWGERVRPNERVLQTIPFVCAVAALARHAGIRDEEVATAFKAAYDAAKAEHSIVGDTDLERAADEATDVVGDFIR